MVNINQKSCVIKYFLLVFSTFILTYVCLSIFFSQAEGEDQSNQNDVKILEENYRSTVVLRAEDGYQIQKEIAELAKAYQANPALAHNAEWQKDYLELYSRLVENAHSLAQIPPPHRFQEESLLLSRSADCFQDSYQINQKWIEGGAVDGMHREAALMSYQCGSEYYAQALNRILSPAPEE